MLTESHRSAFFEQGYTRVSGIISNELATAVSEAIWRELAGHGIHRDHPESRRQSKPRGLQSIAKNSEYASVFGTTVQACIDAMLGEDHWVRPKHWGQLLLSLPVDSQWFVPHQAWHLDLPQSIENLELPGVQVFICVEDIVSHCGATVVASGTHRLVTASLLEDGLPEKSASSILRTRISKSCEWFRQLVSSSHVEHRTDRFMHQAYSSGEISLQVQELTGSKGDIILMHPYLFHAPAPNTGPAFRIALTQRIYSQSAVDTDAAKT